MDQNYYLLALSLAITPRGFGSHHEITLRNMRIKFSPIKLLRLKTKDNPNASKDV